MSKDKGINFPKVYSVKSKELSLEIVKENDDEWYKKLEENRDRIIDRLYINVGGRYESKSVSS
jgi:hypothetical protein